MAEEGKKENECCRCKKSSVKKAFLAGGVLLLVIAVGAVCAVHAQRVRAEKEAAAAEAARIEAITKKPLLEWTEAEKAELADVYEARRQEERKTNPELWTEAEKKAEWWSYTKLQTSKVTKEAVEATKEAVDKAVEAVKKIGE